MQTIFRTNLNKILRIPRKSLLLFAIAFSMLCTVPVHADTIFTDLDDHKISFQHLKGKWVVINYWANWCQPCLSEIAVFNDFHQRYHQKVAVFGVHYDKLPRNQILALVRKYQIHYPHLQNSPARQLNLGRIASVPTTFVFNPEGELVQTLHGPQTLSDLKRASFLSDEKRKKFLF